jgi:hypothetical protein
MFMQKILKYKLALYKTPIQYYAKVADVNKTSLKNEKDVV